MSSNEFGFRRIEIDASTIDAIHVQAVESGRKTVLLQLDPKIHAEPSDLVFPLLNKETGTPLYIHAGAVIESWVVRSSERIPETSSIFFGYVDPQVNTADAQIALASRVVSPNAPLYGSALNLSKKVEFEDILTKDAAVQYIAILNNDLIARGLPAQFTANLDALGPSGVVGEPRALFPAVAIHNGNIPVGSLTFSVTYSL